MAMNWRYAWKPLNERVRILGNGVCELSMNKDFVCLIDEADVPLVCNVRWWAVANTNELYYAYGSPIRGKREIAMHRYLLGMPPQLIDHVNGNGLDNRRSNLRLATQAQNYMNRRSVSLKTGIRQCKKGFSASIRFQRKHVALGRFPSEEAAVAARIAFQKLAYGEFAPDLSVPSDVLEVVRPIFNRIVS